MPEREREEGAKLRDLLGSLGPDRGLRRSLLARRRGNGGDGDGDDGVDAAFEAGRVREEQ